MALLFRHMVWEMVPRLMLFSMVMMTWCYFIYYNHFPWEPMPLMSPEEELENFARQLELEIEQNRSSAVKVIPRSDCSPVTWMNDEDPDNPARTPVWIALYFREQQRCKLIPPSWLSRTEQKQIQEKELRSELVAKMSIDRYISMTKTIFRTCPQDELDGEDVKELVRNVWDARTSSLRNAKVKVAKEEDVAQTQAEMCAGPERPFFPKALEELHQKVAVIIISKNPFEMLLQSMAESIQDHGVKSRSLILL